MEQERGFRGGIKVAQQGLAERRLAGTDLAGNLDETLALADPVDHMGERFAMFLGEVEKGGVGGDRKRFFPKPEKIKVHPLRQFFVQCSVGVSLMQATIWLGSSLTPCGSHVILVFMMAIDRRNTPRFRAYRPVRLQKPGSLQIVETLTKDLGVGGLRCVSPALFPVSTEVNVELVLSSGEEPFSIRGRTVWFLMIPHSEQVELGIEFIELENQNKRRLSVYIDYLASHLSQVPA